MLNTKLDFLLLSGLIFILYACQPEKAEQEKDNENTEDMDQSATLDQPQQPVPDTIEIEAKDYVYLPPDIKAEPGEIVIVRLTNHGEHDHSIKIEMPGDTVTFDEPVPRNNARLLKFKASNQPGTYKFYCPVENHREQAMTGELVIGERPDND